MTRKRIARSSAMTAVAWLAVFVSSCGMSTRVDERLRDAGEAGGTAGGGAMTGTSGSAPGGAGASGGTAGSEGALEPPNCRADVPAVVPLKDDRWIFLEGRPVLEQPSGRYLVELTPDGPRNLVRLADTGGFRGWSADGRFLAFTPSDESPYPISVLDFSQGGLPVAVGVPARSGRVSWSRSDARYALLTEEVPFESLVVVDAATTAEKSIGIPRDLEYAYWSLDGRYVAIVGDGGLALVDTSGTELGASLVHDEPTLEPLFSPDSRHVAFVSGRSEGDRFYLFDIQTQRLELLADAEPSLPTSLEWAGNTWLIGRLGERAVFFDLTVQPLVPIPLATFMDLAPAAKVSPGNKCYAYRGYCEAANEEGACVKALPPDAAKPSVLLRPVGVEAWRPEWAGTGDQLLLIGNFEPWLINVNADGGDFRSRVIAETADNEIVHVGFSPSFNPSGRADWIAFVVRSDSSSGLGFHLRLWNREGGDFDVGDVDTNASHVAWSPDGRYLFVHSDTPGDGHFYVQELIDRELGRNFRISELEPAAEAERWDMYWQP